ncbi:uL13 family ribosomal protein [Candidatus Nomurabacteria bacterium]|nr:uL13 family ribosomal protein [Candidatus Nomurabacteria bacterium]
MEHTIDANGLKLGRVASKAASILMGKNTTKYERNKVSDMSVHIINASKIDLSEKKKRMVKHETYSGYPGGLKKLALENVIESKGYTEAFRLAVYGMLPSNKLRSIMMTKLKITE